jgi:hypothetical protein
MSTRVGSMAPTLSQVGAGGDVTQTLGESRSREDAEVEGHHAIP